MKTQVTPPLKKIIKPLGFMAFVLFVSTSFNPVFGQVEQSNNERTVKGIISNEDGPVEGANIVLKDTKIGTVSNAKGEFTFPRPLKTGDILLVSYLGYETQEVLIKDDTTFIKMALTSDLIEFIGDLDTNKPYKTKRAK